MVDTCPICGGSVTAMHGTVEWDVKGECVAVSGVEHAMCSQCGEVYFEGDVSSYVHRRAVDEYKQRHGLLSGTEIRALREKLGLSQARFEKLLGAGPKTVVRWENGTVFQNGTADTLMRVLRDHPSVACTLMEEKGLRAS
ncbi:type II TA system antitoxin MqsA family protein [Raoultibacter phocaeensis]|uniref:type II TA system antitoxin MqsA family protein n=1 Tax=Raoultibacter phocaeensis TaxID=2479841 RepID=UPI00111AE400|nr:type II TA system antitoxin MqsA family protein [Raoultibacter phocaeensis]